MEPITTELRAELGRAARAYGVDEVTAALVNDQLGAIDAIHEGLERENEELRKYPIWAPESHYMLLPKDADGVPIRVGDELEGYGYPNGGAYCKAIVGEWGILAGEQECNYQRWLLWSADDVRHHHAPTVEDVLREFYTLAVRGKAAYAEDVDNAVLAEYAAKLRLAGDADE